MNLDIKIKNAKHIAEKIQKLGNYELDKARNKWLRMASILVQGQSKKEAPIDKGTLRKYINYELKRDFARVYTNVAYAYWVHEGTRPHVIKAKNTKTLFRKGAEHPIKQVNHPWYKGNPFFTRAIDKTKGRVKRRYEEILDQLIKKELW